MQGGAARRGAARRAETSRTGGETQPGSVELNNKLWAGRKINNKMEGNNTPSEVFCKSDP